MKHMQTIIALGVVVALLPFLGFPSSWKNIIFLIIGGTISVLAFHILASARAYEVPQKKETTENLAAEGYELENPEVVTAHE